MTSATMASTTLHHSIQQSILYQSLFESYQKFRTDKLHIALTVLVDFVFVILLAILFTFFYERMLPHIVSIFNIVGSVPAGGTDEAAARSFVASFDSEAFWAEYRAFLRLGAQFLLAALGLWVVFHALTWKRTHELTTRRMSYVHVVRKFALITAAWAVLVGLFFYVSLKISISTFVGLSLLSPGILQAVFWVVLLVLLYFVFVSYAVLDKYKLEHVVVQPVVVGFRKAHVLIPGFLLVTAKFWLLHFVMVKIVGQASLLRLASAQVSGHGTSLPVVLLVLVVALLAVLLVLAWARFFMASLSHHLVTEMRKGNKKMEGMMERA